uniref:Bm11932 n=1 Tax=Brugia malayi TaxID=6279 RepID=A0A1I9G9X3_BRUMA|nr:Bm11932 [Brugia malayi]
MGSIENSTYNCMGWDEIRSDRVQRHIKQSSQCRHRSERAVHYHAIEELLRGKARAAAGAFPVFISLWVVASSAGVADFPLDG